MKEGDIIQINTKPTMWSSALSDKSPIHLTYPWQGRINKLILDRDGEKVAEISGYGFYMPKVIDFTIINTYEIY